MSSTKKEKMLELVNGQLAAYNQKNLDKFCTFFHPEVEVYRLNQNDMVCKGMEAFRPMYVDRFGLNPNLNCEIKSRIVLEDTILDEEWITGVTGVTTPGHVVAIYGFKDDLIFRCWFAR